jgi:TusA-related sulfurtransferase
LGSIPGASVSEHPSSGRLASSKDKTVLIYCGVGLRGYLAERILRQKRLDRRVHLSGGYKTWQAATERQDNPGAHETRPGKAASCAEPSVQRAVADRGALTYGEGTGAPEGIAARGAGTIVHVDACGLQCPGPIMRLKAEIDKAAEGSRILLSATDPGFGRDVQSWCKLTGNSW